MPDHNPFVELSPVYTAGAGSSSGGAVFSVGSLHFTVIGLVLGATVLYVLLHRAGFRFSIAVGGGNL